MKNRGFTLVELLGVIAIMAVVAVLGSYSISSVTNLIKRNIWNNKIKAIETGAVHYGEDNSYRMKKEGQDKCDFMASNNTGKSLYCIEVSIDYLLKRNYVTTNDRDSANNKVIINNETNEIMNDHTVYVWIENDIVYAKYKE